MYNKLIFEDNFSLDKLDLTKWSYDTGGHGFGNKEWQYYTDREKNVFIDNNQLVLKAYKEQFQNCFYTSGKIYTKNKFSFKYGRIEVKAKLPFGKGIWPAIWMMPEDNKDGWPIGGEIDIMELIGDKTNKIYGTIHYGIPHIYSGGTKILNEGSFSDDFNVFGVIWDEYSIRWSLNGEVYHSETKWFAKNRQGKVIPYPAPFNQKFYLILNLAVGGKWPGYPDETTIFPQEFRIDYVRVYQ